ncbi:MAG: hypothetical protein WC881_05730, partial [Elusimicrobiota bacterium]
MSLRLSNPLAAIVWLTFLFPGRWLSGRSEFAFALAVLAVGCVVLWVKPSPWESRAPARQAAGVFAGLQFLYVISYLYALAFKGAQTGPLDLLELPRWLLLGGFVVYLIRHYGASVHAATESALVAALYGSWFGFASSGERAYAAALTLCYLLLFSRVRLRYLHAAVAAAVWLGAGSLPDWAASAGVFRSIRLSPVFGWGPAGYEAVSASCSQYPLWLMRGGALGAGLILVGLVLAVRRLLRVEEDLRLRAAAAGFLICAALL